MDYEQATELLNNAFVLLTDLADGVSGEIEKALMARVSFLEEDRDFYKEHSKSLEIERGEHRDRIKLMSNLIARQLKAIEKLEKKA